MADSVSLTDFKKHIIQQGVLHPKGVHHEFVSGLHGRKLDFDLIAIESELFKEWVSAVADALRRLYPSEVKKGELVVLSVAGGTNRLVEPVVEKLGTGTALLTEKVSPKAVKLTADAKKYIKAKNPPLVVAIEDVGTKGTTSASAIKSAWQAGAKRVEALNTWQRRKQLEELDTIGVVYNSIIKEFLPTLAPEECQTSGYCAKGWEYIKHD